LSEASTQTTDDFEEPAFRTRIVPLSRISAIDPGIGKIFSSNGIIPTLRLDLKYWNRERLASLLRQYPIHLLESKSDALRVIGGFRLHALAIALSSTEFDPKVLAFIYSGRLSSERRREIVEEEVFALPAFYRHLPGEASAVFNLYFDHFSPVLPGNLISVSTQGDFYKATGFDRRNVRRRHDREITSSPQSEQTQQSVDDTLPGEITDPEHDVVETGEVCVAPSLPPP
jgi:hypothetical protein